MRYSLSHSTELILLVINIAFALFGIVLAYAHYAKSSADPSFGKLEIWIKNKFYLDEIMYALIVRPLHALSNLIVFIDEKIIDAFIHKVSSSYQRLSYYSDYVQNGNVRYYALYMSIGIVGIFVYLYIGGLR
jgi:NADH:ubiquinone oxidoreductase subunit 5 (subunit L)/multisubunit Na+/H+ antiporter MnhA subunit